MTERIPAPAPGVYPGVPHEVYRSWDAVCQSDLKRLQKSPAHLQAYWADPPAQTPAMRLGTAFHAYLLDSSEVFAKSYAIAPCGLDKRTVATIHGMAESLFNNPAIFRVTQGLSLVPHQNEVSIVFRCDGGDFTKNGTILCKGRLDMIRETGPDSWTIVDPKTTTDASPENFGKAAFNLGYHIQAAFYLWGCASLGLSVDKFLFAAVEKTPPYASAVYELDEDFLSLGWMEVRRLLDLYAECTRTNTWPGYPPEPVTLSPPAWATKGL